MTMLVNVLWGVESESFLVVGIGKQIFWHNSSSKQEWETCRELFFFGEGREVIGKNISKIGKHFFLLKRCQIHCVEHKTPLNFKNHTKNIKNHKIGT